MSIDSSLEYSESELARTYDETLYENKTFPESHPDRLAAIAILMGMSPADVSKSRVLEIGCALGGNIIPMAYNLPNSEFVGLDISSAQVNFAQKTCAELNLQNCRIKQMSIIDFSEAEPFDYIIAHGVYSWVPDSVKERIMAICGQLLNPHGIAYISYNVYPGWSMRKSLRDAMLLYVQDTADPKLKASKARMLLEFLADSASEGAYKAFLKGQQKFLSNHSDNYLVHEYLELYNDPIYFHEFASRAQSNKLQYLGDAVFGSENISNFPPNIQSMLRRLTSNKIQQEQYIDFISDRSFRSSILCRADVQIVDDRNCSRIKKLWAGLTAHPTKGSSALTAYLDKINAGTHELSETISKVVTALLSCSPGLLNFEDLGRLTGLCEQSDKLSNAISLLHVQGILTLHATSPSFVSTVTTKPLVGGLAANQVQHGTKVVNLLHETIILNDFARKLVSTMNGNNDRAAIIEIMKSGSSSQESSANDLQNRDSSLERLVDENIEAIRSKALLVG